MPRPKKRKLTNERPAKRPAESAGLAGAVAVLVMKVLGVDDPDVLVALTVVVGALPAAVTFVVDRVSDATR